MPDRVMDWFFLALLLVTVPPLAYYASRVRRDRDQLRQELRRVLRAGAGKLLTQETELSWSRALTDAMPSPVIVTDAETAILYANASADALFGKVEFGEAAIERLRQHRLEELIEEALANGRGSPEMIRIRRQLFLVHTWAWHGPESRPAGAIMLLQDITESSRLARARREMAANLSHELRTPLSSVKLTTEALLSGAIDSPELGRKMVNRIALENEAMIRLVEDLTTLSLIESGRSPLRQERINLRELVEFRLQRLAPQQMEKLIQVELEGPDQCIVALDPERFGQVLTNLLDNAIKFSPVGGKITVRMGSNAQGSTLSIEDQGPGIPPQDLPRLFERFFKGDRARTRSSAAGTGLGLAIVKHLVEAHGGTITAESNLDQGARFTVTLPAE